MAIFKDIPRFDGSGITEYYRVNDGKIVKLSSDYDFLDDKPMINGVVLEGDLSTADLNIPVGDITQLKTEIKDNIVNAINELQTEANDFEKFITDKVNAIISFTIVWVAELPAIKDAKPNTVYLVPKKSMIEDDNYCEEFIFTDGHWEKIGDTKVDLSGYYTKEEINSITQMLEGQVNIILQDYATKAELEERASELEEQVDTILEDYATKELVNELLDITGLHNYIQVGELDENGNLDFEKVKDRGWVLLPQGKPLGRYVDGTFKTNEFNSYNLDGSNATDKRLNSIRMVTFSTYTVQPYCYTKMIWFAPSAGTWEMNGIASGIMYASASGGTALVPPALGSGSGFATLSQVGKLDQTISGLKTFSTLPKSSITPTETNHLTNKKYVDDTVASIDLSPYATVDYVDTQTGDLTTLTTDNKTNLVNAINETNSRKPYATFDIASFRGNVLYVSGTTDAKSGTAFEAAKATANQLLKYGQRTPILGIGGYEDVWLTFAGTFSSSGAQHGWEYVGSGYDGEDQYQASLKLYFKDSDNSFARMIFATSTTYAPLSRTKLLSKTNTTEYTPTKDYHPSTKLYVDTAISNAIKDIHSFEIEVVSQLPTTNISTHTLYLVPSEKVEDNNTKDEYIYTGSAWEMIGTTKIDLSNYYTKPEVDEKVDNLYLRCNREEYEAMSQEDRDSFLVAIVDDIAVLTEQDLTNITKVLGGNASKDMEIDISTNEAIAITDKIIGGTE